MFTSSLTWHILTSFTVAQDESHYRRQFEKERYVERELAIELIEEEAKAVELEQGRRRGCT